jgi:hypothetical protein
MNERCSLPRFIHRKMSAHGGIQTGDDLLLTMVKNNVFAVPLLGKFLYPPFCAF